MAGRPNRARHRIWDRRRSHHWKDQPGAEEPALRSGPKDAEKRVSEVVTQAKVTADKARKGAVKLSLWLTASMLIGAFAASLAATEGGRLRDRA
jgi:hypothetical protein